MAGPGPAHYFLRADRLRDRAKRYGMADALSPDDLRPVIALARDYADGMLVAAHAHDRAQLLYGLSGAVVVTTATGTWTMPPDRGLWIPAAVIHEVRMVGRVRMRNLYLRPEAAPDMPARCAVVAVTHLVRALLAEAALLPEPPAPASSAPRDTALVELLLLEMPRLEPLALNVPLPTSPHLRALCDSFMRLPRAVVRIDDWSDALHMTRRSFTRRFRSETGLSFGAWRQRACVLAAIPRLIAGQSVTTVALDLGYDNPGVFATMFRRITGEQPSRYSSGQHSPQVSPAKCTPT